MILNLSPVAARFCQHPVPTRHAIPATVIWRSPLLKQYLAAEHLTFASEFVPLLMRSPLLVARLQDDLCVKMRTPPEAIYHELERYESMPPPVQSAFVPLLCVFEVELGGKKWAGICMPFVAHTMCHVLASGKMPINLDALVSRFVEAPPCPDAHFGLPLPPDAQPCTTQAHLEVRLLRACFGLLLLLHQNGWVHGDTHLGNFLLDSKTWRVCLIDAGRSFPTHDAVQHFLDVQELFAHATGMIVSLQDRVSWDLTDIAAVASKMHPCLTNQGTPFNNFMPVCSCFVQEKRECRERGCSMCRSALNVSQANAYSNRALTWLRKTDHGGFTALTFQIQCCRQDVSKEVQRLIYLLAPSIPFLQRFIKKMRPDKMNPTLRYLDALLYTFYEDPLSMDLWFKYALYRGAFVENGSKHARAFVKLLVQSGLHALAKDFQQAIAAMHSFAP